MGGLAEAYRSYTILWTADRIRSEWIAFRGQSRTVMGALRRRISREEQELYPLLEPSGPRDRDSGDPMR